jgi:hypothetical protein
MTPGKAGLVAEIHQHWWNSANSRGFFRALAQKLPA